MTYIFTKKEKWEGEHPCLCDKCLEARDKEIVRVRKQARKEILERIGELLKEHPGILWEELKEILKKEI